MSQMKMLYRQSMLVTIGFALLLALVLIWSLPIKAQIPSNKRSEEVKKRVKPVLKAAFNDKQLSLGDPVFIRIFKSPPELEVWVKSDDNKYVMLKKYDVCTHGFSIPGPKTRQGDGKAPEGFYFVTPGRLNPWSRFHLSFNLGYPNKYDRLHGRTGANLMVHGDCASIGCFAMTDDFIEEIYTIAVSALERGQQFIRVHIFPFRMSEANMQKNRNSKWIDFWRNLKEGYDHFEKARVPPNVEVKNKRYVFDSSR